MTQTMPGTRTAFRWPRAALVGGAAAVLASYVPPSWYGQSVVGSNIGAGFLWVLGVVAMVAGTVAVVRSAATSGGLAAGKSSVVVCASCWAIAVAAFLVGIVTYRA